MKVLPEWVRIKTPLQSDLYQNLGPGEREAIALAHELEAANVLMDERLAREIAIQSGLAVTGTIGMLEAAAAHNLLDLPATHERLRRTNFRFEVSLFAAALARDCQRKRPQQ